MTSPRDQSKQQRGRHDRPREPPSKMSVSDVGFQVALSEAQKGASQGGVPIGACLVSKAGKVLGQGHNMRVQQGSATLHAEISALEASGRLPAAAYEGATMYTTLSPCDMCTGACLLYKIGRVVMGENRTFVGGEAYLKKHGVEVVNLDLEEPREMMERFIRDHPKIWYDDALITRRSTAISLYCGGLDFMLTSTFLSGSVRSRHEDIGIP